LKICARPATYPDGVIAETVLARGDGFVVADVRCRAGRSRGFDDPEQRNGHVLVAVRHGAFMRRVRGRDVLVDGSVAYLSAPGSVEQFAHPVAGGDVCTAIWLAPPLLAQLAGGDPCFSDPALPMDPASELAVRRLTAGARRGGPASELAEPVVRLVTTLLGRREPERVASGRPATAAARRLLVERAQAVMLAEPAAGLVEIARRIGCSPHHLSRVFAQLTGMSVTFYRNRLRVSRALERLAEGEPSLAALAAELGFADHAHLTRTIQAATGRTPTECRDELIAGLPSA
jgi:AraC-like DNA-binding protein